MNKFYFHFGDYCNDGHGRYATICVQTPKTRAEIQEIINKVDFKHPAINNWNNGLAIAYENNHIGNLVWDEIIALGYPLSRLVEKCDDCVLDYPSWEKLREHYDLSTLYAGIDLVIDIYLFMLNYYGAELEEVEVEHSNHFDFGYGYGCFY